MFKTAFVFLLTIMAIGFVLNASPGMTDSRGGHNCWSNCEQYGLYQGEYHIHKRANTFITD